MARTRKYPRYRDRARFPTGTEPHEHGHQELQVCLSHDDPRRLDPYGTNKPPSGGLLFGLLAFQKGTTTNSMINRQTCPMVITAGSIDIERFVFMGVFFVLFLVSGTNLRASIVVVIPDRATGGLH